MPQARTKEHYGGRTTSAAMTSIGKRYMTSATIMSDHGTTSFVT
jgi:hypothetical protein